MTTVRLFLCGDVMTGRGIDQILTHPANPVIYEQYAKSALDYVALAEGRNGPIPRPVTYQYIWGDALVELERRRPAARIVNLETSITTSESYVDKGINYRMHPANSPVLTNAKIDCCSLANNHVLDWGRKGLEETLRTLDEASIRYAGAGRDAEEAAAPAQVSLGGGARALVFAYGCPSSGIPHSWSADEGPGVNLLRDFSEPTVREIARTVENARKEGDLLIASIHWGRNWGYHIPESQRQFAHRLIETAGFHVVHGHSSHHPKAVEFHHGRLILYGCGDFITDYEGIAGYEEFRGDLSVMYLPELSLTGSVTELRMLVFRMQKFRLACASSEETCWMRQILARETAAFGVRVNLHGGNEIVAVR
jgi:poly-gamma-glutamate synthesis protein (capsule biosynthesis protein)